MTACLRCGREIDADGARRLCGTCRRCRVTAGREPLSHDEVRELRARVRREMAARGVRLDDTPLPTRVQQPARRRFPRRVAAIVREYPIDWRSRSSEHAALRAALCRRLARDLAMTQVEIAEALQLAPRSVARLLGRAERGVGDARQTV